MSFWHHVVYNYRDGGLTRIGEKILWRIGHPLWSDTSWLIYQVSLGEYDRRPSLPLVRRELSFEDQVRHGYYKIAAFPEAVRARLDSGGRCHGFFLDNVLVNTAWTTGGHLRLEPGLSIPDPDGAGIFDCHTDPAYRSRGIYKDTLTCLLRMLRDEGARIAMIGVDPGNVPSIRGIEKAGFVPLCRLTRERRFGRSLIRRCDFRPVVVPQS